MPFSMRMTDDPTIRVSFSFYPQDMEVLETRVTELKQAGLNVRDATLLRALIHLTPPAEMFAHAVLLASALAKKPGPREDDDVAGRPTVRLPKAHVKKLDDVADELARKDVIMANRAFIVRALLRATPPGRELAPGIKGFLKEFPNKPRGLPAVLLARKKRSDGRC